MDTTSEKGTSMNTTDLRRLAEQARDYGRIYVSLSDELTWEAILALLDERDEWTKLTKYLLERPRERFVSEASDE